MTRIEQHKLIQELRDFAPKMSRDDQSKFEMLQKRDRDEEDLDSLGVKKLEELYAKYVKHQSKKQADELWKKLTGGGSDSITEA